MNGLDPEYVPPAYRMWVWLGKPERHQFGWALAGAVVVVANLVGALIYLVLG